MPGSKYDDELRQKLLALVASGLSASKAAAQLGVPKSTACNWVAIAKESSDEFHAERELARRKIINRCYKVVDRASRAIEQQMNDVASSRVQISKGLKVLQRLAGKEGNLSAEEIELLRKIIASHVDIPMKDIAKTWEQVYEQKGNLERELCEDATSNILALADVISKPAQNRNIKDFEE